MTTGEASGTPRDQLVKLLSLDPAALRVRVAGLFDSLVKPGTPLVLFGAGGLGRKTLAGLRAEGIHPLAITDNAAALHGQRLDGVEILPPGEAARRFGKDAAFVVAVHLGPEAICRQLEALGCRTALPFHPLFWKFPERFLPHYAYDLPHKMLAVSDQVLAAFDLLADDESRAEFLAQVRWRLDPRAADPPAAATHEIYFPPGIVEIAPDERFVDCGGFDGDTVRSFLRHAASGFGKIFVFEPDPENLHRLETAVAALAPAVADRVRIHPIALDSAPATLRLELRGPASTVSSSGGHAVRADTLDRVLDGERTTFIKMDVEGAELRVLQGGVAHLRQYRPLLAVSAYHTQDHLWAIPRFLHGLHPGYRFYLRRYTGEINDDLVLYATDRESRTKEGSAGRA